MVKITGEYEGELRCRSIHEPSGESIVTDAPVDNHGRGMAFSPTDLCATALATCIVTIMGIRAESFGLDLKGLKYTVIKEMSAELPRRIGKLTLEIVMPSKFSKSHQTSLERAAKTCPVFLSLHPGIEKEITVLWPDA